MSKIILISVEILMTKTNQLIKSVASGFRRCSYLRFISALNYLNVIVLINIESRNVFLLLHFFFGKRDLVYICMQRKTHS